MLLTQRSTSPVLGVSPSVMGCVSVRWLGCKKGNLPAVKNRKSVMRLPVKPMQPLCISLPSSLFFVSLGLFASCPTVGLCAVKVPFTEQAVHMSHKGDGQLCLALLSSSSVFECRAAMLQGHEDCVSVLICFAHREDLMVYGRKRKNTHSAGSDALCFGRHRRRCCTSASCFLCLLFVPRTSAVLLRSHCLTNAERVVQATTS